MSRQAPADLQSWREGGLITDLSRAGGSYVGTVGLAFNGSEGKPFLAQRACGGPPSALLAALSRGEENTALPRHWR